MNRGSSNSYKVEDAEQNKENRMPVPIKFRNCVEYCSLDLCDLTQETFLEDGKRYM